MNVWKEECLTVQENLAHNLHSHYLLRYYLELRREHRTEIRLFDKLEMIKQARIYLFRYHTSKRRLNQARSNVHDDIVSYEVDNVQVKVVA